ncbi:MAG: nucleotide exchange factor GrpE [Ruminococcaceae bacterium]|nr:nucleotide exchange factor GrpE [Oscillospiraceae bacterium]
MTEENKVNGIADECECEEKTPKCEKKSKKEITALKEENEKLQQELALEKDKYLRLAAEYDNFRRRTQKEKEQIYSDSYADIIEQLLPIIDNFETASKFSSGDKLAEGVQMILSQAFEVFEKMGVTEIETKTFDPNVHNAVMHIEDDAYGEGEIVEVFRKGYRRGDKIIRYAMVKVAN